MNDQSVKYLCELIWQNSAENPERRIFGLLDAARSDTIYPYLRDHVPTAQSLFQGSRARELALVSPYLMALTPNQALSQWFFLNGWGRQWGILCESTEAGNILLRHFQKIIAVYSDEGKPLYFRFYDPRVLKLYLQSATPDDLKKLFGPVAAFYVEGNTPDSLTQYILSSDRLVTRNLDLPDAVSG